jgi:hypothetical protein
MRKNILNLHLSWILALLWSFGCYSPTAIAYSDEEEILSPSSSETLQPVVIETNTVVPTPFITPIPTLLTDEQEIYIKEFLEGNTDCRLPCWWGITPGKTSWQESETLLRHLGAIIKQFQSEAGGDRYGVRLLGLPELNLSFYDNGIPNSKVDRIFVGGNEGGGQDQREFEVFWESYSPKEVMSKYGVPSRILLYTMGTLGNTDLGIHGYTLWIFYDLLGFMIRYDGTISDLPTYHFCFELKEGVGDIHRISLTLQHPDNPLPLERDDSILGSDSSRSVPIQNATDISIEEFHRLFTQNDKTYCFDTPHDIWPMR